MNRVLAIAAHPDDIEFVMAGTMLRLAELGWELHYLNVSSGNCGSTLMNAEETRRVRGGEARTAASLLGATFHAGICDDLEVFYDRPTLRWLAGLVREVQPQIVLTHSPEDYMEEHMIVARLAVTAAFAHGMPNFSTEPPREPFESDITVYHAMPHGLTDGLRRPVEPDFYVDTTAVQDRKREALACHQSQQEWLDTSQGMNSYLQAMDDMAAKLGERSGQSFRYAEAWRRHSHLGFSSEEIDPLQACLNGGGA